MPGQTHIIFTAFDWPSCLTYLFVPYFGLLWSTFINMLALTALSDLTICGKLFPCITGSPCNEIVSHTMNLLHWTNTALESLLGLGLFSCFHQGQRNQRFLSQPNPPMETLKTPTDQDLVGNFKNEIFLRKMLWMQLSKQMLFGQSSCFRYINEYHTFKHVLTP